MAEIVNLNKVRKSRALEARETKAAENRIRYGRTKAARIESDKDASRTKERLDGKRLD